jgi:hypothetical protein
MRSALRYKIFNVEDVSADAENVVIKQLLYTYV